MRIRRRDLRRLISEMFLLNEEKLPCHSETEVDAAIKRAVFLLDMEDTGLDLFLKEIAVKESGRNTRGLSYSNKGFSVDCFLKKQVGGGPALGPWQVEPETFEFLKKNWKLASIRKTVFERAGKGLQNPLSEQDVSMFINSLSMQALTAALKMIDKMNPRSLEQRYDKVNDNQAVMFTVPGAREDRAALWKTYYNTSSGAGTEQEYIDVNDANGTSI